MKIGYSFDGLANYVEEINRTSVKTTGDQTIAGVKTFSDTPLSSTTPTKRDKSKKVANTEFVYGALADSAGVAGNSQGLLAWTLSTSTVSKDVAVSIQSNLLVAGDGSAVRRGPTGQMAFNVDVVGAGGMDVGPVLNGGYIAVYHICNLTTNVDALLGVNVDDLSNITLRKIATPVYNGTNLPAGFTYSALVGVYYVQKGSRALIPFLQRGNYVATQSLMLATFTGPITYGQPMRALALSYTDGSPNSDGRVFIPPCANARSLVALANAWGVDTTAKYNIVFCMYTPNAIGEVGCWFDLAGAPNGVTSAGMTMSAGPSENSLYVNFAPTGPGTYNVKLYFGYNGYYL